MSEVNGKIKVLGETKTFGANGFQKRELVVTTEEQYPQDLMIEFTQDKCSLLDAFKLGDNVKVDINLRGREWTSPTGEVKYFNSLGGWKIEKTNSTESAPTQSAPTQSDNSNEPNDDLPF